MEDKEIDNEKDLEGRSLRRVLQLETFHCFDVKRRRRTRMRTRRRRRTRRRIRRRTGP